MSKSKAVPYNLADQFFKGESVFFQDKPQVTPSPAAREVKETPAAASFTPPPEPEPQVISSPVHSPVKKVASQAIAKKASLLASYQPEQIETIRRTVKKGGRIVSFVRLTEAEKDQLTDIVYTYKRRGMKTTENEINRIAINYLLDDYKRNGEESLLAQVIDALLA